MCNLHGRAHLGCSQVRVACANGDVEPSSRCSFKIIAGQWFSLFCCLELAWMTSIPGHKLFFALGYLGMSSPQVVTPTNSKEHTPYWNIIALHMEALKSANTCVPAGKHGHAAVFWVS